MYYTNDFQTFEKYWMAWNVYYTYDFEAQKMSHKQSVPFYGQSQILGPDRPQTPDEILKVDVYLKCKGVKRSSLNGTLSWPSENIFAKNCKDDIYLCLLIELTSCFDFEYSLRAYNTCMEHHKMISKH